MSLLLYKLGNTIARHRVAVLGAWALVLVLFAGGHALTGGTFQDDFTIPGTQSQQGQQVIDDRFSSASGANGQVLFRTVSSSDGSITDAANAATVSGIVSKIEKIPGVSSISDPVETDSLDVDEKGDAALAMLQFSSSTPSDATLAAVQTAAVAPKGSAVSTTVGGSAFKDGITGAGGKISELIGILIALAVLVISFGSFVAAGMPLITALIGVAATITGIGLVSGFATISSTSPTFAEMLGLAVGIDYGLFILSRHRAQLRDGLTPRESMARALGTSGSAVVFAGTTVIIALAGLSVANIPFLSVMGLAGAGAVLIAVLVALTALPAIALLLGERLRPRTKKRQKKQRVGFATRWVTLVTRRPVITIAAVVIALGIVAIPATGIRLALPDASTSAVGTTQRDNFDATAQTFGPGYNAPLIVTANIITSSKPTDTVADLADGIKKLDGVVAVSRATPNPEADTALIQVIPEGGQNDQSTADLVHELRSHSAELEKKYGVSDILVTGTTAINIDVSERLANALVPFGLTVAGLSIVLLMIVFRSIAVPLKATLGYLLSVAASFGAIVAVFQWGWLSTFFGVTATGPVVSFLPILVMGVLFGLAMDYEMFLVSRMREECARSRDARSAIFAGFRQSSPVVTSAAIIMVCVFAAFIPGGSSTIKPIALGLAVGVFVDAFIVRMTFVPAVLMLLGAKAWWMPRWLDRLLPVVDVEGAVLERHVQSVEWREHNGEATILARALVVDPRAEPLDLVVRPGTAVEVQATDAASARALAFAFTGHGMPISGDLVVAGSLMPEQRETVREQTALIGVTRADDASTVADYFAARASLATWSVRRRRTIERTMWSLAPEGVRDLHLGSLADADRLAVEAAAALAMRTRVLVAVGTVDGRIARLLVSAGATLIAIVPRDTPSSRQHDLTEAAAR